MRYMHEYTIIHGVRAMGRKEPKGLLLRRRRGTAVFYVYL